MGSSEDEGNLMISMMKKEEVQYSTEVSCRIVQI
jgi:hypothetical protein